MVESLEIGGLERLAVDLALAHQAAGHRSLVYCLLRLGALTAELKRAGIPVVNFERGKNSRVRVAWEMAQQMKRDRPDVVHGHNSGVHHFAAVAKRIAGVPVCLNTRHSAYTSSGEPYQERYFRWVEPWTDHVVFDCGYVKKLLDPRLRYPAAKCSVILNGIPLDAFLAHPASPGSVRPRIRFGAVGRLVPAKGHSVLIEAFSRVIREVPGAELRIFGDGPLRGELQAQIDRLGLAGRVVLAGWSSNSAETLASFDVFVFSSLNEGLPLVILEAMAAGLPIVSTRVGGVPEVLPEKRFPWFCEAGDAAGLASMMIRAERSTNLAADGSAAREIAAAHYGLPQMTARYQRLYDRLLGR